MPGFLRLASVDETIKLTHEGGDWIEVRANLAKKDMDKIIRALPSSLISGGSVQVNFADASDMAKTLFENLVVGWSLDIPCTFDNYENLDNEAAQWVDTQLYEHFANLQTSKVESGKAQASRKA